MMDALQMTSGSFDTLTDQEGFDWIDFRSGIMTASLGHGSVVVGRALQEAVATGIFNSYVNHTPAEENLRSLLHRFQPGYEWHLFTTGAEAIDRAWQLCSARLGRSARLVAISGGFHGKMMHLAPIRYDLPNPCEVVTFDPDDDVIPDFDVLIYEPIQSLTGRVLDEGLLRRLCDERGAILIADEMVTGFYRAGRPFWSSTADVIVGGKALGQGIPLSVIGLGPKLQGVPLVVEWSTTAAGNNICATVGLAVLRELMQNQKKYLDATNRAQKHLMDSGCDKAFGALGFHFSKNPPALRESLKRHRILATVRDDGVLRLGPPFQMPEKQYIRLQQAIEDSK